MKSSRLYVYKLLTALMPETSCFALKAALLRWCGAKVGRNVRIGSSTTIIGVGDLEIGDDVWIGARCFISLAAPAGIYIGRNCDFGPEVMLFNGSHEIAAQGERVAGKGTAKTICVGEGCWLGARSTILPGVQLAARTLVAAGSVVTKSVEEDSRLVAGVPAFVKRRL